MSLRSSEVDCWRPCSFSAQQALQIELDVAQMGARRPRCSRRAVSRPGAAAPARVGLGPRRGAASAADWRASCRTAWRPCPTARRWPDWPRSAPLRHGREPIGGVPYSRPSARAAPARRPGSSLRPRPRERPDEIRVRARQPLLEVVEEPVLRLSGGEIQKAEHERADDRPNMLAENAVPMPLSGLPRPDLS